MFIEICRRIVVNSARAEFEHAPNGDRGSSRATVILSIRNVEAIVDDGLTRSSRELLDQ